MKRTKSRQLAEFLRQRIVTQTLKPGEQLETVAKLARHYETSIATISKALEILEQSGYIERFHGKGIFVRQQRQCNIALALDVNFSDPLQALSSMPMFLRAIEAKCAELNWSCKVFFNINDYESSVELRQAVALNNFDAVLIASRWLAENLSSVFANNNVQQIGIFDYKDVKSTVCFDSSAMFFQSVCMLDKLKCSKIACVSFLQDASWHKKPDAIHDGYLLGLKTIGKLYDKRLDVKVELSQAGGVEALHKLLKFKNDSPLGIIIADAIITLGMIQEVLNSNLNIPKDVVLVTHANKGCGIAAFPTPVIKYEYDISEQVEYIVKLISQNRSGKLNDLNEVWLMPHKNNPFNEATL